MCLIVVWYIGSTHTFTPREFVDDLKVLELGGVGSRAVPNGLREPRNGQRSYQEYYDERYFTRDAPPPQRAEPPKQIKSSHSKQQQQQPARRPSPEPSLGGSTLSVNSVGTPGREGGKDKDKKKHRFLKW